MVLCFEPIPEALAPPLAYVDGPAVYGPLGPDPLPYFCGLAPWKDAYVFYLFAGTPPERKALLFLVFSLPPMPDFSTWLREFY